jgi:hypothetical protein
MSEEAGWREEGTHAGERKVLTLGDLLESPLVGMWADREDIEDGAEFARQLRDRASKREVSSTDVSGSAMASV